MATGFSPEIYSEGAVVFDSTPSVELTKQIVNRQLAKDEALDNYFRDMNKSLNPAGMRTQDVPGFIAKTNELRDFYMKHKDAIRNPRKDGGMAQNEYYGRYQDALGNINQSKQEAEALKPLMSAFANPETRSRIPETVFDAVQAHELPLGDPNRKSFNMASMSFDPKPFDIKEQQSYFKGYDDIKMSENIAVGPTDPKSLTQTLTTTYSMSPQDKETISKRASSSYIGTPSFKRFIDDMAKQPELVNSLNKTFRDNYGDDIRTPEDLATAWTLGGIQTDRQTQKAQADWKAQQDYRHKQAIDLMSRRPKKDDGEVAYDSWLEDVWDNLYVPAMDPQGIARITTSNFIPLDPVTAKALSRDGQEPDALQALPGDRVKPVFYKRDGQGAIVRDEEGAPETIPSLSRDISKQQWKMAMGGKVLTKKDLTKEMVETKAKKPKHPLPAGKPRVVKQGGYTYTWNEQTGNYE